MAQSVPFGIDFFGSFKSPDMATPAVNPVTAGKKIAKMVSKGRASGFAENSGASGCNWILVRNPKAIETNERAIAPRTINCERMARDVLINARMTRIKMATVPTMRISVWVVPKFRNSRIGSMLRKFSAKPTRYKAMLRAVPTNIVIPIDPPIGRPKLRESM